MQKKLDESEAQRKLLQAEIQTLSGKLSNSSEQGIYAANQAEQLTKRIQESQEKIRRLEAAVAKYSSGYEAVVQEKVKEKDQIINDLMKEHSDFLKKTEALKQELVKSNMRMERYRKIVTDARDTAEKAISENRKLRGQFKMLDLDPAALKSVEAIESTAIPKNVLDALQEDQEIKEEPVDTAKYDSLMAQAAAAEKDKKFDDALWLYLQAADVNPKNPAPQMAIAFLHCYYEDFASAGKAYDKALRLGAAKNKDLEKLLKR